MNTRFQQRARTVVLFTFAVLLPILPARAELPWRRPEISIKADNKSAADLLRALAVEQGISLQLNAAAATPISGDFK